MLSRHCVNAIFLIAIVLLLGTKLHAQSIPYEGPSDEAGDPSAARLGLMNGNRVSLQISNKVSFGGWPSPLVSLWPNDASGLNTFDSFNLIVADMVFIKKCDTCAVDSIPVINEGEIQSLASEGKLDTLWYAQSSSIQPNFMDLDATGRIEWGFYPVFGYSNPASNYPAMSTKPDSWPTAGWPSRGTETKWPGEWNGRFGRGVKYTDLEAYWVCNDAQDQEYLPANRNPRVQYFPRPQVKIGDLHPGDISVQKGDAWGGLGMRAQVRAYQWNNMTARDAVFFEYDVSNISDYDLTRAVFGFYLDAANGNKAPTSGLEDQIGYYNTNLDLVYTWSRSGAGFGGGKPCVSGWAFLESPGISTDGIDNDNDGMVDERRDNTAEMSWQGLPQKIVGSANIISSFAATHDTIKFFQSYGFTKIDQVSCVQQGVWWPADENGDWKDGNDINGNGVYDIGEDAGNDVGLDGVGPNDLNYTGPDADGTECNHKPDYKEGIGAEPNFAATDVAESDMLGLTSFVMFPHPQAGSPQLKFDRAVYDTVANHRLIPFYGTPSNLYAAFGSGTFRLQQGRTERLSMSNVNSYDDLTGLNNSTNNHPSPSLYAKAKVVRLIYLNSYRFAQPPITPTLTATAGDGKVFLSWDDKSDKLTHEPFLGGINDFEGYRLYKSTDVHFQDAEVLRDAYGSPGGKKPIFQCDLKDSIMGFYDYSANNGLMYDLGDDSGLRHSYIDNDVQNGRTYYYGLTSYDYGLRPTGQFSVGIPPTENNLTVDLDEGENILSVGSNIQVVTPHQQAAGYVPPAITMMDSLNVQANGTIQPTVFNFDHVKSHLYNIKFDTVTLGVLTSGNYHHKRDRLLATIGYSVSDVTLGGTPLFKETLTNHLDVNWEKATIPNSVGGITTTAFFRPNISGMTSNVIDGVQIFIKPKSALPVMDTTLTGWKTGSAPIGVRPNAIRSPFFAYDYEIIFIDTTQEPSYKTKTTRYNIPPIADVENVTLSSAKKILLRTSFPFHVINRSFPDTSASAYKGYEELDMVVYDVNGNGVWDPKTDTVLVGYPISLGSNWGFASTIFGIRFLDSLNMPHPGDVYRVRFTSAFSDSIMFKVNVDSSTSAPKTKEDMKQIKVVPNPYIVTNTLEPYISNIGYNQRRRLLFTHIPAQSTIKIFTSSGVFIRQVEVNNSVDDGTYHWDMLTKEGLEIAAGIYVYQVKSKATGEEKFGKFAVIK
jgi:hypothetical protein